MFILVRHGKQNNNWLYIIFAILIYAVMFGCRDGVGVDYYTYLEHYQRVLNSEHSVALFTPYEKGFMLFIKVLAGFKLHFAIFFGLVAFMQLYLIFKSIKRDKYIYEPLIFTFIFGCIFLSYSNGIRQILAFSAFAYAITYIPQRKWYIYTLIILLASTIHTSCIILLALYPALIYKKEWFNNIKLQLCFFAGAIILGQIDIISGYLHVFDYIMMLNSTYEGYMEYDTELHKEIKIGLGFLITIVTNVIIILKSNETKQTLKSNTLIYIYNLYYIGVLIKYAFMQSHLIQRFNIYFYGFDYIMGAYTLYYLYHKKENKEFLLLTSTYILTFVAFMSKMFENTIAFRFFWERQDF